MLERLFASRRRPVANPDKQASHRERTNRSSGPLEIPMRVLGFIPELTVTAWAVVRAGPGRGKKRKDEFSIDLDVTGSCRLSHLPALFKTLPAPDLIAIPEPPWRWVGQRIGVRRIVRACRHRVDFPEPVLITTDETRDTLCGSTEISGEAFLERFFMLMPGAAHLFASDDTPSAEGLAALPALVLLLQAKDIRLDDELVVKPVLVRSSTIRPAAR